MAMFKNNKEVLRILKKGSEVLSIYKKGKLCPIFIEEDPLDYLTFTSYGSGWNHFLFWKNENTPYYSAINSNWGVGPDPRYFGCNIRAIKKKL